MVEADAPLFVDLRIYPNQKFDHSRYVSVTNTNPLYMQREKYWCLLFPDGCTLVCEPVIRDDLFVEDGIDENGIGVHPVVYHRFTEGVRLLMDAQGKDRTSARALELNTTEAYEERRNEEVSVEFTRGTRKEIMQLPDNLKERIISRRLHGYPILASLDGSKTPVKNILVLRILDTFAV